MRSTSSISHPVPVTHSQKRSKQKKVQKYAESEEILPAQSIVKPFQPNAAPEDLFQNIQYDKPSGKSQQALARYLQILNHQKHEQIRTLFYVDVYV